MSRHGFAVRIVALREAPRWVTAPSKSDFARSCERS